MTVDSSTIFSETEANQNFSRVAKIAEEKGHVVVFKNNRPKLLVIDLDTEPQIEMTEDEKLEFVAARILRENRLYTKTAAVELHKMRQSNLFTVTKFCKNSYIANCG